MSSCCKSDWIFFYELVTIFKSERVCRELRILHSGGQWQKLAILRCMNATSSLIILDEPTSAIDPKAEIKLYDAFRQLSTGKLSFMITHRLGSINSVDRVLVIDQGSLVQDGDPTILKQETGVFKELWLTQAAMYE